MPELRRSRVPVAGERSTALYCPEGGRGLPLVLNLHGTGSGPVEQMRISALAEVAGRHGFAVAAPRGSGRSGAGHAWAVPSGGSGPEDGSPSNTAPEHSGPDDSGYLLALIDTLVAAGVADPGRVYAAGMSGGARMACHLAAAHPGRIAAVAAVAGLRAPRAQAGNRDAPGVPVIAFHGTADRVNPFDGGGPDYWGEAVPEALRGWAEANGCASGPRRERVSEHVRLAYAACRGGSDAVLYVVEGGGHTWPGSRAPFPGLGPVASDLDASEIIWDFFRPRRAGSD